MDPRGIFARGHLKEEFLVLIGDLFPSISLTDAVWGPKAIFGYLLRMVFDMLQLSRQVSRISIEQDTAVLQHLPIEGRI
jgi:hypothetical protein